MSLQFVFGFLFGLLFLLVIGCGNDTRTKFLKKAEKVLHSSYTPLVQSSEQIRVHQSWFRLYPEYEYDPSTYHVSRTLSVHLELRDNFLMISYTPYRMSTKMMISHTAKKLQNSKFFCHFRQIDLKLYHIYLLPNALKSDRFVFSVDFFFFENLVLFSSKTFSYFIIEFGVKSIRYV